MLKDGVVLFVLCLLVVGGVAVWWTQTPTRPLAATVEQPAPAVEPAAKPVAPKPKPKAKTDVPFPVDAPVVAAASTPAPEFAPAAASAPAVPQAAPPPFPAVEQIASGQREGAITSKYGDPSLSAVTSTGGHMVETYVYSRNRGRMVTVIRLQDGKVATAYSQAEPMLPAGLSTPQRSGGE